ncbi:hypothetical protein [Nocardia stercoris]|nr:hypothetical protein [Nocardia stercoris]
MTSAAPLPRSMIRAASTGRVSAGFDEMGDAHEGARHQRVQVGGAMHLRHIRIGEPSAQPAPARDPRMTQIRRGRELPGGSAGLGRGRVETRGQLRVRQAACQAFTQRDRMQRRDGHALGIERVERALTSSVQSTPSTMFCQYSRWLRALGSRPDIPTMAIGSRARRLSSVTEIPLEPRCGEPCRSGGDDGGGGGGRDEFGRDGGEQAMTGRARVQAVQVFGYRTVSPDRTTAAAGADGSRYPERTVVESDSTMCVDVICCPVPRS